MAEEPMTLIERLRNPAWQMTGDYDPVLDPTRTRADMSEAADKLDRIKSEAAAIADALGARGLIDFADDVRMLTKL